MAMVEMKHAKIPVSTQAKLLGINRTSLYYRAKPASSKEIKLKHRIDEIYTKVPFYGSRKVTITLKNEGWGISRPTVQKYMREMGIQAIYPKPRLSQPGKGHKIYPYLLRNLKPSKPNQVWGVDITYVKLKHGWLYLYAILDWYSRFVVAWSLDQTLAVDFILDATSQILEIYTPEIINSDQGSQFTGHEYLDLLKKHQVQISMDGKRRAIDNIFTERLWRSVKYEEIYLHEYTSPREARQSLSKYFNFYNYERIHQSLDYQTPASFFFSGDNSIQKENILLKPALFLS